MMRAAIVLFGSLTIGLNGTSIGNKGVIQPRSADRRSTHPIE